MKKNLLNTPVIAFLALTIQPLFAGPLQRADVLADPAWVLHLDCDALRPTALGKHLLSEMDKPEAQAKLAVFQSLFSFDLRTQLHGLTVYSAGSAKDDSVALVYADFDSARLTSLAQAANDSQSTDYKSHVIYNWIDEKKKAKDGVKPRTYAAVVGTRVIFAQHEEPVKRALDVVDGSTPNLSASRTFADWAAARPGGFLKAAARKLDIPSSDPNAALFKLAKRILLQVGESGNEVRATLTLEANDTEVAGYMATAAQGLVALLKLQPDKPETVKLAQAVALKQDGARLEVNLALPANDVVGMIKADAARKAQKTTEKAAQ